MAVKSGVRIQLTEATELPRPMLVYRPIYLGFRTLGGTGLFVRIMCAIN